MKTFIRWQGNKSKHIKHLIKYIPKDIMSNEFKGTYIEPFVGSGALFLKLQPKKWIINDLNKDLINIWKNVKENDFDIIKKFKFFEKQFKPMSRENKIIFCKKQVLKIDTLDYNVYRASLFLLMKFCSYMGHIFVNNKFMFAGLDLNISIKNNYSFLKDTYYNLLSDIADYLNESNGKIYNKDYIKILEEAKKDDFVFLDPPYFEKKELYQFNYNKDEVIDQLFLDNLKIQLVNLDKRGVRWIMTNADTTEVHKTFTKFKIKKFKVYRANSNSYKNELIILSNNIKI